MRLFGAWRVVCVILFALVCSNWAPHGVGGYLGNVASRTYVPYNFFAGNTQLMSRSCHVAEDNITSLQLVFWNGYVDNPGSTFNELGTGGTMTLTAGIEYPLGALPTQVKWSGVASASLASNQVMVSDAVSVTIPKGVLFAVRNLQLNSAGLISSATGASAASPCADGAIAGTTGVPDLTVSTSTVTASQFPLPPVAIIGQTSQKSYFLLGDSRVVGSADAFSTSMDIGILARSIANPVSGSPASAYANAGVPGIDAAQVAASHSVRAQIANAYFSSVIVALGANDNQSQLATLETNLQTIYALFPKKKVYSVTVDPATTFPGNVESINFAPLNAYLRLGSGVLKVFDMSSVMENDTTGTWASIGNTSDGIHENQTGCLFIQSSGIIATPYLLRRDLDPASNDNAPMYLAVVG